jgi:exopolyphosphatase/guanosine-5'-triphosphate,3'-diphosphate pyrophosphatase
MGNSVTGNIKTKLRRVAVIDCGTNTFNLRVVDLLPIDNSDLRPWNKVFSLRLPVRLGKGGIVKGVIRPDRIARGLDAIGVMHEIIRNYKAQEVYVIATSALRDASNGNVFTEGVWNRFGYKVQIISGATEATLIQAGIELTYTPLEGQTILTMDIGGGSTECILWDDSKVIWSRSFDVGVARLQELFKMTDIFGEDAYVKMFPYLSDVFEPLSIALSNTTPSILVGSSGSFDTFYSLTKPKNKRKLKESLIDKPEINLIRQPHPTARVIDIEKFNDLSELIIRNSLKDRLEISGMPPDRADFLPYAAAIVKWLQSKSEIKSIYRSKYAVREGLLSRLAKGEDAVPGME